MASAVRFTSNFSIMERPGIRIVGTEVAGMSAIVATSGADVPCTNTSGTFHDAKTAPVEVRSHVAGVMVKSPPKRRFLHAIGPLGTQFGPMFTIEVPSHAWAQTLRSPPLET